MVGQGGALKEQVQLMVKTLLKLQGEMNPDAADAIGIARYSREIRKGQTPPRRWLVGGSAALIGHRAVKARVEASSVARRGGRRRRL